MTLAPIMGIPVEESAPALAPAGAVISGLAVVARSTAARFVDWLRRRA